ncbi:hypothetical protein EKP13_25470 [Salmonella enterica]|nr:hypothetical protein [Salmonella enterica]EAT1017828.1 hypothetical protein [Salmonella enterica]
MKKTEKTVRIAHTVKRTPFSASVLFHREARRWVQVLMSGVRYLDAAGWLSVPEHVRQLKGLQQQTAVFMTLTGEEADRPRRQQQWQYLQQHCAPLPGEVLVFIGRSHQYLCLQACLGERYAGAVVHLYLSRLLARFGSTHRAVSA